MPDSKKKYSLLKSLVFPKLKRKIQTPSYLGLLMTTDYSYFGSYLMNRLGILFIYYL